MTPLFIRGNYSSLQPAHPCFASHRDYQQTAAEDNLFPTGMLSPFNTPNPLKAQVKLKSNKKGPLIKGKIQDLHSPI